jgi:predicted DNA-binding protein
MKTIQITLPDDLHQRLKDTAWSRRKTQADTLRDVLDENLPLSTTGRGDAKVEGVDR